MAETICSSFGLITIDDGEVDDDFDADQQAPAGLLCLFFEISIYVLAARETKKSPSAFRASAAGRGRRSHFTPSLLLATPHSQVDRRGATQC
jgi:hypothetical protein